MATQEQLLKICQVCPFKQRWCTEGQPCLCTADGIDIHEHARAGHCPQNLYPPVTTPPPPQQQQGQEASVTQQPSVVSSIAHGAAGIARAVTGTGGANEELVRHRTSICATCPQNVLSMGLIHKCELCGCLTWAKARNLEEKCPAGKW